MSDSASEPSTSVIDRPFPGIRRREDVTGCGCVRCQSVRYDVVRRSITGATMWSLDLLRRRPSVLLAFLILGGVQIGIEHGFSGGSTVYADPLPDAALLAAVVGFLGVFLGRGYAGLVAASAVRRIDADGTPARLVVRRFPSFLVAAAVVAVTLLGFVVVVTSWASPAVNAVLPAIGLADATTAVDAALLVAVAAALLVVLVKLCFLPEACFVGGYGPVAALRVTWSLTTVHRRKAVGLTVGLLALFVLGSLLDARIGSAARPVVLSVTLYDTTVPVRSIGLAASNPLRLLVDASLSAAYYVLFAHQYVHALFDA